MIRCFHRVDEEGAVVAGFQEVRLFVSHPFLCERLANFVPAAVQFRHPASEGVFLRRFHLRNCKLDHGSVTVSDL